ncbi:DUF4064 domain-containing protein [Cytobacillus sp. IB215665]|uniref:DUF4064 domain-containing protein n=1 Tax=Cytobacillus sp. IB215665 TaxID=3097357 RepID=UPI002A1283B1|nr:DUF4064 domain-containing protein [Cytobacillus sp. IB215665]MDX8366041.1 DUF4064 domain-containing protein [Cytobacillus sp. IB215665]
MKRTGEIIISGIASILSALIAIIGAGMIYYLKNEEFLSELEDELALDYPDVAVTNITDFIESMASTAWLVMVAGFISLMLGLIAAFSLRGNKKPLLAGTSLIIAAVPITFITLVASLLNEILGYLTALLFLIAGMMSLVRKRKQTYVLEGTIRLEGENNTSPFKQ